MAGMTPSGNAGMFGGGGSNADFKKALNSSRLSNP